MRACPKLGAQIDTGWAIWGGEDPAAMAKRLGEQFRCMHMKELAMDWQAQKGNGIFAVLGEGVSDVKAQVEATGDRPIIIDQDCPIRNLYDDLERTIRCLKRYIG